MINEKIKKTFKVVGIVVAVLFLWGVFNLFFGTNKKVDPINGMMDDYSGGIQSSALPSRDISFSNKLETPMEGEMMEASVESDMMAVADEQVVEDKKVIKNGNLTIKVESTEEAADKVAQIAKAQGGEVFSTNFSERVKGQKRGSVSIKVPVAKFEETVEALKKIATQVVDEFTTGQDVTEQYADLQAQLKNKRAEEESFVKILDRAGEIDDVLAVTKQIARVRGEIERLEGRIKFMDSQTDMSTIVVNISEDIEIAPVSNDWRPIQVIKKSFSELINNSQDFIDGLIRFIIVGIPSLIPFLIFLAIIYWIGKKIYKKIKS